MSSSDDIRGQAGGASSPVNTEGIGVWCPWPGDTRWTWWAWTPEGLLSGREPSEAEAWAKAREAMAVTRLKPKGSG